MQGVIESALGFLLGLGVLSLLKKLWMECGRRRWIPRIVLRVPLPIRQYRSKVLVRELQSSTHYREKYKPSLEVTQRTLGRWFDNDPETFYPFMEDLVCVMYVPNEIEDWIFDFVNEEVLIQDLCPGDVLGVGGSNNVVQAIEPVQNGQYRVVFNEHNVQTWTGEESQIRVRSVSRTSLPV